MGEVDERVADRLDEFIADGDGQVPLTFVRNMLGHRQRLALNVVLASGRYIVADAPGGQVVRRRTT